MVYIWEMYRISWYGNDFGLKIEKIFELILSFTKLSISLCPSSTLPTPLDKISEKKCEYFSKISFKIEKITRREF